MFEILEKSSGNIIGIKVRGKLVHEDYAQFVPKLEQLIEQHGSIRCYCELTEFHGLTPHALWDELKFDAKHCRDIERCAIVGDPSWHHWMTKMGQTIFRRADVRYFDESQSQEAWDWVCEGVESSGTPEQEVTATTA